MAGQPNKKHKKLNSEAFQHFSSRMLRGFLVESWGTFIEENISSSSEVNPAGCRALKDDKDLAIV